tara:strand:+ start:151 stop:384 length:234 start_codon:yes stop_codon:yes gene_type:complete
VNYHEKKPIFRKRYVAHAVCLSHGEKSGKEAGLTLNFAVRDVRDLIKIRKLVKKPNQFVDFGAKSSKYFVSRFRVDK